MNTNQGQADAVLRSRILTRIDAAALTVPSIR